MKLRQQLQSHGYSKSFTTDEKGPFHLEVWKQLMFFFVVGFDVTVNVVFVSQIQRSFLLSSCTTFSHWILY